jgi:acyl carrier protein
MKKSDFFEEIKEILEIDENFEVNEDTILSELEEYDSLSIMSIVALVDEKFNATLTGEQLFDVDSVRSLIKIIGADKFS